MSPSGPPIDPLFLSLQLTLAGRYSIDRELGRGGMGIVYLAREVHLDRLVAIKLLPPERATQPLLRDRFLREARLAARLSHPNIIPIHAVEESDGLVFYVMAFVDGVTLAHRVRTRGPLSSSEGSRVLREVAWALAYAHSNGVVHRDVKPDNILLETSSGRVLVADFGIAAAAGEIATDGIAGTPEFMSPEQALGGTVDARSDLYGLGATAFYAFSGRLPFEGKTATEVLAKQVTEAAPPLASLGIGVPRKLASIIDRCLAKEPDHRPPSAESLAEQLGVSLEQRREQPAALRSFVKRSRLDGSGTIIGAIGVLGASVSAAHFGMVAGFATLAVGATAGPLAYLVATARRLTVLGFGRQDLEPAFKGEIEQAREELAVDRPGNRPVALERWLPGIAKTSAASAVILTGAAIASWSPQFDSLLSRPDVFSWIGFGLVLSVTTAALTTIGYLALAQQRRDVGTEFWSKVWMGRIGKLAFALARKSLGNRVLGPAMTHRATELSLGMAAEQLYESLPKESQRALGDLPSLLGRLQQDAQLLRVRYDELQEALSDAGDVAASERYADVREARDVVHAKLGDAVGALETIRLNLLRLHAGSATVESLTTHLGLAADVSEEVERLIAANDEIGNMLKFPRETAATPV
ncbi:MAG TPA: serine/threonine-protein kinase [Gemmatimonadaceae bacterium]|nr:serine/threonine-protein kinase [Gemmatimonadaceae bacterium]